MRNLIRAHRGALDVASITAPDLPLTNVDFDPISDTMLTTFGPSDDIPTVEIQQLNKNGQANVLASWSCDSKVVSVKFFSESGTLVLILRNGDIVSIDPATEQIEIVASIETTVMAAKWSPDEEILAIVSVDSIMLLSRALETISETQINVTDLKISRHVSVGWGKRETQFEGRGAKAMRDPTVPQKVDRGDCVADDDGRISISWRGDGEYVAINSVDTVHDTELTTGASIQYNRRTIRVYGRDGLLNSVSEPVDGLEPEICWRPSGNVISSIQRVPGSGALKVIQFERNGLKRNDFDLRVSSNDKIQLVRGLSWNCDSDVFAVNFGPFVQLWTCSNYQWHLKQEIQTVDGNATVLFHPEKPRSLIMHDASQIVTHTLLWDLITGPTCEPFDLGTVVIVDGTTVKVTPLKIANTPPPMAFREFQVSSTPIHVAVDKTNEQFAILFADRVEIYQWKCNNSAANAIDDPVKLTDFPLSSLRGEPKQLAFVQDSVAVATHDNQIGIYHSGSWTNIELAVFILKATSDFQAFVAETLDCRVYSINPGENVDGPAIVELFTLPRRCISIEVDGPTQVVFGLTETGRLYANARQLTQSVTSLMISERHVVFTTAQHLLKFCHIESDVELMQVPQDDDTQIDERCRSIERGSLLVSLIPSKTALVLQAPRGNLETIHPRIMVLGEVRKFILNKQYDAAFALCRTHRIDLNLLHDYAPAQFYDCLDLFVKQLDKVEYIDLFLSGLKEEDVADTMYKETLGQHQLQEQDNKPQVVTQPTSKVNQICDAMLKRLVSDPKYLQSSLTAYACKSPPDLESALKLVGELYHGKDINSAERAIEHLCFLQDVNLLYDTALGLYDLDLTLLVAQRSQKDPKECLPFLRSLGAQPQLRKQYLIDKHLRKYDKALHSLVQLEDAFESELKDFVVEHSLYTRALSLFKHNKDRQQQILNLYARHLESDRSYTEAGLIFEQLDKRDDALRCYEQALDWKRALSVSPKSSVDEVASKLAERIADAHQYADAAIIYQEYLKDVKQAIECYCKGCLFDDAIRACALYAKPELLHDLVDPLLLESFSQIGELLADCKSQIKSQVNRLRELRSKKESDPFNFYGDLDNAADAPDYVSLAATESTTAPSFFTRYTGKTGGTAQTGVSRKTAKNRRREERKRARGKKGSIYEEEYLINSMGRLIERLEQTIDDASRLIDGLIRRNKDTHAQQIQKSFVEVLDDVREVVVEVFTLSEKDRQRYDDEGNLYYIPEKLIPNVPQFPKRQIIDW